MQTSHTTQELRLLFPPAAVDGQRVALTDGDGRQIGVERPFTPLLSDADYDDLRWYTNIGHKRL